MSHGGLDKALVKPGGHGKAMTFDLRKVCQWDLERKQPGITASIAKDDAAAQTFVRLLLESLPDPVTEEQPRPVREFPQQRKGGSHEVTNQHRSDLRAPERRHILADLTGDERSQVADALARIEQALEQGDATGWGDVVRTKLVTARSLLVEALGPEPEAPKRKKF